MHHTFSLPVYAHHLVTVYTLEALQTAYRLAQRQQQPLLLLGQGSNVLFCQHFSGTVILMRIGGIAVTETASAWHLHVGAGCNWHQLVCQTVQQGMPGLENLALIPGCVGAAPIQNIGAYGVEFKDLCDYVDVLDLEQQTQLRLPAAACRFGYRDSLFKQHYRTGFAIIAVGLKLTKQWHPQLSYGELNQLNRKTITPQQLFEKICATRCDKLPDYKKIGNAGSFFKNPVIMPEQFKHLSARYPHMPYYTLPHQQIKISAGWLIEQVGLKGYRIGNAAVDLRQALVLTNLGGATPLEVLALARHVRQQVAVQFDIELIPEVRFIGAYGEIEPAQVLV